MHISLEEGVVASYRSVPYQEIEDILGHSHQFALSVGLLLLYMDQALVVHIFFFKAIMQKG